MSWASILPELAATSGLSFTSWLWSRTKKRNDSNLCCRKCAIRGNQRGLGDDVAAIYSIGHNAWIRDDLRFQGSGETIYRKSRFNLIVLGKPMAVYAR